ncbi:ribosome recycling factor [Candidatus Gottesmanbacteria bacterium]|nr:ribosome recycling factor [Candidatus Gottesmanbacteria bacterium]
MDDQLISELRLQMQKAFGVTKNDLGSVRTGRATPQLVEYIEILTYGGSTKLKLRELATITSSDAKTLLIHPYDPSTKEDIVRGIMEANIGFTPVTDNENIRISIPPLSEERRQEYLKLAKAKLEAGKVMIRQIRHEKMADLKRAYEAKEFTEDDKKRFEKKIQDVTDEMVDQLEELGDKKEQELLQI